MTNIPSKFLVKESIPHSIREDYPGFVSFLEAYYGYIAEQESNNGANLAPIDLRDIDKTLDAFTDNIMRDVSLGDYTTTNFAVQRKLLIKHINDVYAAKGSEQSYKLLLQMLTGKQSKIAHPSEQLFKLSDGSWEQDLSIVVRTIQGNTFDLVGKQITINSSNYIQTLNVVRVILVPSTINTYEIFFKTSDKLNGISINDIISAVDYSGTILPSITNYIIYKPGLKFKVNQTVLIRIPNGVPALASIKRINASGGIEKLSLITFGGGVTAEFTNIVFNNTRRFESISSSSTSLDTQYETYSDYLSTSDNGFVSRNTHWSDAYADSTYVGELASIFASEAQTAVYEEVELLETAEIIYKIGAIRRYPGFYSNNKSFISDNNHLHDGNYYQQYSYVIKINEELSTYKGIIKKLLHPIGTKMFAEYELTTNLSIAPMLKVILNYFRIAVDEQITTLSNTAFWISKFVTDVNQITTADANTRLVGKSIQNDDVTFNAANSYIFAVTKALADSTTIESTGQLFEIGKLIEEAFEATHSAPEFSIEKSMVDSITAVSAAAKYIGKLLDDAVTAVDDPKLTVGKLADADSVTISEYLVATLVFGSALADAFSTSDTSYFDFTKTLNSDSFTASTTALVNAITKALNEDIVSFTESPSHSVTKALNDGSDSVTFTEYLVALLVVEKALGDSFSVTDSSALIELGKILSDTVSLVEAVSLINTYVRSIGETVTVTESGNILVNYYMETTTYWNFNYSEGTETIF